MKKIIRALLLGLCLKGLAMAVELKNLEVKGVQIPVIYEKSSQLPLFHMQVIFKGAGAVSNHQSYGLSDITSSLLNEGTKALGATKFAQKLEERAITLNVGSGLETMNFTLSGMKAEQEKALEYLKELIQSPNFTPKALEKVRENALITLLEKENDFDYQAQKGLNAMIFKGSAMEYPLGGTTQSLQKITLKEIEAFYKHYINLKSMILVIGGDVEFETLKKRLQNTFESLPIGEEVAIPMILVSDKSEMKTLKKDTKQAYIYFGAPFFVQDFQKESAKIKVASFVLGGGGFGSRMLEEVRVKRGLAYSAMMYLSSRNAFSYAQGYLQTSLENQKEALKIVKEVVGEYLAKGMTQKELNEAKQYLLGSEPLRNETLEQRLGSAFNYYYRGLPLDFGSQVLQEIQNLKLQEINDYIKKHQEIKNLSFFVVTE